MIESCSFQVVEAPVGEANPGRDQVRIETEPVRFGHENLEIVAQKRLTTGKPELCRAELTCFAQRGEPLRGVELATVRSVVNRVVAEYAMQRAAVRELCEQPERRCDRGGRSLRRFVGDRVGKIVHCGKAFSIESSMVQRMSSLNCRISSARSCCSRRVK